MAQNGQPHRAKPRKVDKEKRNFRTPLGDFEHARGGHSNHRQSMSVTRYMADARSKLSFRKRTHRGKDYFMSKIKLNHMIRTEDNLAARREANAEKAFLHTQARTAQRWLAAEPIYPLR